VIALILLLSGAAIAVYGNLCISQNPVGAKADGVIIALFGYAIIGAGLIVAVLT
jgi:hypothetical protein